MKAYQKVVKGTIILSFVANSRIMAFKSHSSVPGMYACMHVIGQYSALQKFSQVQCFCERIQHFLAAALCVCSFSVFGLNADDSGDWHIQF